MNKVRILSAVACAIAATAAEAQDPSPLSDLLGRTHVHGLAFDPQDENRVLLATHHGLHAVDLVTGEQAGIGNSQQDFMGFTIGADGSFFASGHPEAGGNSGVLLSADGGVNWTKVSDGLGGPVDFHQMTTSPADPGTLYGAYAGELQRSRNAGATWEVVGPAPEGLIDLAGSALDGDTLYAATELGLLMSKDGGQSWTTAHPSPLPVSFVESGPEGTLYAFILSQGLVRADEASLTSALVSEPLGGEYILHFTTDGTRAVAVTGSGTLLFSESEGEDWIVIGG